MCFKQEGTIFILNKRLNIVGHFTYVDDILILVNNTNEIKILQDTHQKIQFLTLLMN